MELWFDREDFRLYPLHPFLHLLRSGPVFEADLIVEAEQRYGWKERQARNYIAKLGDLKDAAGDPVVTDAYLGHSKLLSLRGEPVPPDPEEEEVREG